MENLNFFTVDPAYVQFLKAAEAEERGFARVPNMEDNRYGKAKFLLGVVLTVNGTDYYVPVTSFKTQQKDNFLIRVDNGAITSSLRFNYMFPIPREMVSVRVISTEPDRAYRAFLAQELRYCIKHRDEIQHYAERTYKRVLIGKDPGLLANSCAFRFLEGKCREWIAAHRLEAPAQTPERSAAPSKEESPENPASVLARLQSLTAASRKEAPAEKDKPSDRQHKPSRRK